MRSLKSKADVHEVWNKGCRYMRIINVFIKNRVTLELLVSLFAIAGAILYVQRPHSLPLVLRGILWLLIICAVLAAAVKFSLVIAERKSSSRLSEKEPRVRVDWWGSIAGIIAVVITGSLLRNLAIPFMLVVFLTAMTFSFRSLRTVCIFFAYELKFEI